MPNQEVLSMNLLRRDELEALIGSVGAPSISIYIPTHRAGDEVQQDPIRLKNALRLSEERLVERGMRGPDARKLLDQASRLLPDDLFWRHQLDGLALFVSRTLFRYYRLPLRFEPLTVVADRFHVKPLLPLFTDDARFYVLALSQKQVRLLTATRHSVAEVPLDGVTNAMVEALRYDDVAHLQRRVSVRAGGASMFQGHGPAVEDNKENLLRFFHQLDRGLHEVLRDERSPLVLAGVDYLLHIFREANTYRHVLDETVEGNPDEMRAEELQRLAWQLVEPHCKAKQRLAAEHYREAAGGKRASNQLPEIIRGAYHGRVDCLFVPNELQIWGAFDPVSDQVTLRGQPQPGDEDLLDFAAIHTVLQRGAVFATAQSEMPDRPLAAIFRY
jgi:hypothetical protein